MKKWNVIERLTGNDRVAKVPQVIGVPCVYFGKFFLFFFIFFANGMIKCKGKKCSLMDLGI